jgi:hypothetical protein
MLFKSTQIQFKKEKKKELKTDYMSKRVCCKQENGILRKRKRKTGYNSMAHTVSSRPVVGHGVERSHLGISKSYLHLSFCLYSFLSSLLIFFP